MAERKNPFPDDADRQEQLLPAAPGDDPDLAEITVRAEAPEADVIEQATPAGVQPSVQNPAHRRYRSELIPEADAIEQTLPADREVFEDDE